MEFISHPNVLNHQTGSHPEAAGRILSFGTIPTATLDTEESILLSVHTPNYIEKIKSAATESRSLDGDTHTSPLSFQAALTAAQLALHAAETSNFAIARPPGHHAYANKASGFCLFNNIAIAAAHQVQQGKKVFIFDFDGHYGDGTASIFEESDQVLVCSIHQYPAFPGLGDITEIGRGKGIGHTICIPVPAHSGDDILFDAFKAILPIVKKFNPDIVGVSAGFDGHIHDPLLDLRYSLDGYHKIGKMIAENFPRIFAVLEGGYNISYLHKAAENFLAGINNKKSIHRERPTDSEMLVWNHYEYRLDELLTQLKTLWGL